MTSPSSTVPDDGVAAASPPRTTGETIVAHVEYVSDDVEAVGAPLQYLLTVLSDPFNLALVGIGGLLTVVGLLSYLYVYESAPREIDLVRATLTDNADFLPWLLRLSLGLPLVGAGFSGYFISPAVPAPASPLLTLVTRLFLVAVGFALLYGIFTRYVAAVGLLVYALAALVMPTLLLASEYVGGFLAIVLLGGGRPSFDQLHERLIRDSETRYRGLEWFDGPSVRVDGWLDRHQRYTPTVIRLGLGVNFIATGLYDKILQPEQALAVVEKYQLTSVVPVDPGLWIVGAGGVEIGLGVALLVGLFTRGVATVAFGMFTLTLFALPDDPVLAHISLFGLVTALLITGSGPLALDNL